MTEPAETLPAETLPAATVAAQDPFGAARAEFEAEIAFLESEDAANLDHAALEDRLIESNRRGTCCCARATSISGQHANSGSP